MNTSLLWRCRGSFAEILCSFDKGLKSTQDDPFCIASELGGRRECWWARLFCGDAGHFCGDLGLFCGDVELFWGDDGLFFFCRGDNGLFVLSRSHTRALVCRGSKQGQNTAPSGTYIYKCIHVYAFMHLSTSPALQDSWALGWVLRSTSLCRDVGHFCWDIGLFCGETGLFYRETRQLVGQ